MNARLDEGVNNFILVGDNEAITSGTVQRVIMQEAGTRHIDVNVITERDGVSFMTVDFTAPTQAQLHKVSETISEIVGNRGVCHVSCGAGIGRTGTYLRGFLGNRYGVSARDTDLFANDFFDGTMLETREQTQALIMFLGY